MKIRAVKRVVPALILVLTSCNFNQMFEEVRTFDSFSWNKDRILTFDVPVNDTLNAYNIYLTVRNTFEYPYSNLFMFVDYTAPNGTSLNDTVQYFLADESGRWYGKGFGTMRTNKLLLRQNIRFPYKGIYTFNIQQAMRQEDLDGIASVGLLIDEF